MENIKVRVNEKMAGYGGSLVDIENRDEKGNAPVIATTPVVVKATPFVLARLRAGDLVMVLDSKGEEIKTEETPSPKKGSNK